MKLFSFLRSTPKTDHIHNWDLVSRTYAPPRKDVASFVGDKTHILSLEKLFFGVTSLMWRCTICHEFHKEELLGSDEETLDELIEKAEVYGPQFIIQGDKTYALTRYVPPVQAGALPVR